MSKNLDFDVDLGRTSKKVTSKSKKANHNFDKGSLFQDQGIFNFREDFLEPDFSKTKIKVTFEI